MHRCCSATGVRAHRVPILYHPHSARPALSSPPPCPSGSTNAATESFIAFGKALAAIPTLRRRCVGTKECFYHEFREWKKREHDAGRGFRCADLKCPCKRYEFQVQYAVPVTNVAADCCLVVRVKGRRGLRPRTTVAERRFRLWPPAYGAGAGPGWAC